MKKYIAWALIGGVIGGCIGYLYAKKEQKRQTESTEEEYDEEWEEMNNFDEDLDEEECSARKDIDTDNEIKHAWDKPSLESIVDENGYRNYTKLSGERPKIESPISNVVVEEKENIEEEESEEEEMFDEMPAEIEEGIVIIDDDSYNNAYPLDRHIGLYYYEDDDVLADEEGEIIDDIEETIGDEALSEFGNEYPDLVHVRNGFTGTCYEITRLHKGYHHFH